MDWATVEFALFPLFALAVFSGRLAAGPAGPGRADG